MNIEKASMSKVLLSNKFHVFCQKINKYEAKLAVNTSRAFPFEMLVSNV